MKNLKILFFVAVFAALCSCHLSAQSGTTERQGRRLTCASDDGARHFCAANTSYGVRMVNQRSGSPCVQGSTWGFTRRAIWVDRGCRADFILGGYGPGPGGPGPGPGPGFVPGPPPPPPPVTLTCSSDDGRRNYCAADTRAGVRLLRQRSGSPCVQGSTWGYDRRGIWVDRGCRADFALGGRR